MPIFTGDMSHIQIHHVKLAKRLAASTKSIHTGPKIKTQINGKFNFYYLSIFAH